MQVQWILAYIVLGCVIELARASLNWIDNDIDVYGPEASKRSLGEVCRCCTTRRDLRCCQACVYQYRSPIPFYTKRQSELTPALPPVIDYPKRGRFRGRSQCGCCFTRRLWWCCASCQRSFWGGGSYRKRSSDTENFSVPQDGLSPWPESVDEPAIEDVDDMYLEKEDNKNAPFPIIDVPTFPIENMRQDCLCCFLYDKVSCCDRCKNAAR